jgi:hypothetical protein
MTHREDPLLAAWRYGLGRTVAFTADAKGKWGVLWLHWRDFGRLWGQVVRWSLRTNAPTDVTATVERENGQGVVTVDAVDPQGRFINFLDAHAGVVRPDKSQSVVDLEQVGPGRYRGVFPAPQEGVYLAGLSERLGEQPAGSQLLSFVVPYAEEYRKLGVDAALLDELAQVTAGRRLGEPKDAFTLNRRRSRVPTDLWPWLAGAVTLALVPEVALRRLGPALGRRGRGPATPASGGADPRRPPAPSADS